ncbi:MAG TPA: hypothetical protein VNS46_09365 [Nocardioides sp.]|nr:hypothetical protein [Nocardioides sp.]
MTAVERVAWTPTETEVRALARGAARIVLRRSLAWLAGWCAVVAALVVVSDGLLAALVWVGVPFLALVVLYVVVTHRRNLRVVSAAYPVGVEAHAEASDEGVLMVTAVQTTQLPWSRLAQPRIEGTVISVRDTVTRRRSVLARQLFPDAWIDRLRP